MSSSTVPSSARAAERPWTDLLGLSVSRLETGYDLPGIHAMGGVRSLSTRQGLPAHTVRAGRSLTTTDRAPTTQSSPTSTPGPTNTSAPIHRLFPYGNGFRNQGHGPSAVIVGACAEMAVLAYVGAPLEGGLPGRRPLLSDRSWHGVQGQILWENDGCSRENDHLMGPGHIGAEQLQQARSGPGP